MEIDTPSNYTELVMLGEFVVPVNFPHFDKLGIYGGAEERHFPPQESVPKEYFDRKNKWNERATKLFFDGGKISVKQEFDQTKVFRAVFGYLTSLNVSQERKMATVAWLLDKHTMENGND